MINVTNCSNVNMRFCSLKFFLSHWKNLPNWFITIFGAHNWTRTNDLFLTKEVLYRLSYVGPSHLCQILERVMGIEPTLSAWKAEVLPLNYTRASTDFTKLVEGEGFEPSKAEPSDLQSDPFDRSGTPPKRTPFSFMLIVKVNGSLN
jgi:hypothetical protein